MTTARRPVRIEIDASLSRLAYRCYPNGCPAGRTCCIGLAVTVSRREVRAIDAIMDEVARLVPRLRQGDGYADVFGDDGLGLLIEPFDDRGACPFLFRKGGRDLCSLHHVALATGRAVPSVKPAACRHWPLVLEARGRSLRIAVHPDAESIGCVAPRAELPGQPSMREAFAAEIEEIRRIARGGR